MDNTSKVRILKQSLIFSSLDENESLGLSKITVERSYAPDEFIFWEGDTADWLYIVAAGRIKILKHSSSGREFIIAFFGPGEMFGEVAVFEGKSYPASAQVVNDAVVLGIRKEDFELFLSENPRVAVGAINVLAGRLREAQGRLKDLAGERVEQRLAKILLMLSSKLGSDLPFTKQEIADMTGTTTETAIRVMSRLKDGGIIRSTRGKIIIIDKVKLELLSESAL